MPRFSECWRCGHTVGVEIICQLCEIAKYCSEKCQKNDIFRHEAECVPASVLKTCTTCRKSGQNLKACTGCYRAFYCGTSCQRNNWDRHKIDCLEVKESIELTTKQVLFHYFARTETQCACPYFYWGNVPAFDCLNLMENEGITYSLPLNVLFLGVGDLRNVALTCASLPASYENKITFTLNDRESCALARLVLLIYMLSVGDIGVDKTVTEIWYSTSLSEATYKSLCTSLQDLISCNSAESLKSKAFGLICIDEIQFKKLQDVWKKWLGLRVEGTNWIQKERFQGNHSDREFIQRHKSYIENVPSEHRHSAKKWVDDGAFKRTPGRTFAENPTLTGEYPKARYAPHSYRAPLEVIPFSGWDYLQAKKLKNSDCIVTMYGEYIECILRHFMKRMLKKQVSFKVVLCDCIDIKRHLEKGTLFDRILTSNLIDYIFPPHLLKLCSEILNHKNHNATIVTETIMWGRDIMPEVDVVWPANQKRLPKFEKIALEDTKRSFEMDGGISVREYLDNSGEFFDYLRAVFYANRLKRAMVNIFTKNEPCTIPTAKELGNEFQLRLRDGIRNENKIAFFRPAINRRRVSIVTGMERYLEWVPLHKK